MLCSPRLIRSGPKYSAPNESERGEPLRDETRDEAARLLWEVCYHLFHEVRRHLEPRLRDHGLVSVAQMAILGVLCARGDQRLVDLAGALQLPVSTLSESCDRLVADGLLSRQPNPEDRRSHVLGVTAQGRQVLAAMRQAATCHLAGLLASLDDATAAEVQRSLRSLAAVVVQGRAAEAAPGADPAREP
jgi:DNA-binding MarR family transcriptional regulator